MTSPTFSQLGIPFELFDAPAEAARDYAGIATCSICQTIGEHCFSLGVGTERILPCPQCMTGIVATRSVVPRPRWGGICHACEATLDIPIIGESQQLGCYSCLRSSYFTITKDTELGLIGYLEAVRGITNGVPGLTRTDFELVPKDSGWIGARVPREFMMELLRTPTYRTMQGDKWLFCCARPMSFAGQWSKKDYSDNAPDGSGQALFERITRGSLPGRLKDVLDAGVSIYVFRCRTCKEYSAHWDYW